ncbi:MAG: efflux RND transporter periplasmic adaptor subunit [Bacteroidales bacterium]|nr:efflux RND transporter periplasmic adaptor subunit [Bacteroidales bacterium]
MKRIVLLAMVSALILSACRTQEKETAGPSLVRLCSVQSVQEAEHASYPGRTRASQTSNVAFRVSGTLADVKVKEGDFVREGQILALLDDRDYKVQLSAVEAEYQQTKADCERIIGLYRDGSTTAQNYDKARYGLEQITAKYQHARDQLADCRLKAPFTGYIQNIIHESHETVSAGLPVLSMFCSDGIEIAINLPAVEYLRSNDFESFTVSFDVLPGQQFPLRLLSLSQRANANQLFEARFLLERRSENTGILQKIMPGMTAIVDIRYKENGAAPVKVPAGSVLYEKEQTYVFVYKPAGEQVGTIHQTPVTVKSLCSDGSVLIRQGLTDGQQIVESGVHHLENGQTVRPNPAPSKSNVGGLL